MGRVIAFSEFREYLGGLGFSDREYVRACLLDTNILISLTYEARDDAEEITSFLDALVEEGFQCFTTVTTRAEFLDFHRRLMATEHLLGVVAPDSELKIPPRVRAQIQVQQGQLRRYAQQGRDAVFYDSNIKRIKTAFLSEGADGLELWKAFCSVFLEGRLARMDDELVKLGISYVSANEQAQQGLFARKITWTDAQRISEETCLGMSDSLILNALQCSKFPFAVSADADFGIAVLSSPKMKDVVMPDSVASKLLTLRLGVSSQTGESCERA